MSLYFWLQSQLTELKHLLKIGLDGKADLGHDHPDIQPSAAWEDITGKPDQATRWPAWSEVTSKPAEFAPESHEHPWNQIYGQPAYATRWPYWGEVQGKPTTFTPTAHNHDDRYYTESEVDAALAGKLDASSSDVCNYEAFYNLGTDHQIDSTSYVTMMSILLPTVAADEYLIIEVSGSAWARYTPHAKFRLYTTARWFSMGSIHIHSDGARSIVGAFGGTFRFSNGEASGHLCYFQAAAISGEVRIDPVYSTALRYMYVYVRRIKT